MKRLWTAVPLAALALSLCACGGSPAAETGINLSVTAEAEEVYSIGCNADNSPSPAGRSALT